MIKLESRPNVSLYIKPEAVNAVSSVCDNTSSPYKTSVVIGNSTFLVVEDIDSVLQKLGVTPSMPVEYKVTPIETYPRETPKTKKKVAPSKPRKTTKKRR